MLPKSFWPSELNFTTQHYAKATNTHELSQALLSSGTTDLGPRPIMYSAVINTHLYRSLEPGHWPLVTGEGSKVSVLLVLLLPFCAAFQQPFPLLSVATSRSLPRSVAGTFNHERG